MRADLVRRAQRGDAEAFGVLASAAYSGLCAMAQRILRDQDVAQDAVQECLVRAWRGMRGLRDPDRFDAWLHRLLVNACYAESRRHRRRAMELRVLPLDQPTAGDAASDLAERDALERGFRRLPVEQRAVLVLHHYLGLHLPEIARTLGIPEGTARSRLHYATVAMRAVLEADTRIGLVVNGGRTA